jgi:hypothetical protein
LVGVWAGEKGNIKKRRNQLKLVRQSYDVSGLPATVAGSEVFQPSSLLTVPVGMAPKPVGTPIVV